MHAVQPPEPQVKRERECIHSGQFMVSTFEAEEQDDEDEVAVPIPEEVEIETITTTTIVPVKQFTREPHPNINHNLSIDTSLAKLFQCMSLAYRQKLTSPKWNRFRGIRLRWKDKIRLNNVIWRCWHLQFIKKENTLICQFASPLDVDTHNKPEAVVLEGKYWKRKLAAVTAEYKKWRMFYRNHALGQNIKDDIEMLNEVDLLTWNSQSTENMHMMVDEDYMGLMSDTLFSTITNQPFVFPDSREIARAGLADFIQPSLGPLQPNLDDYMDTFEPLQEFISQTYGKLPTVMEEQAQPTSWSYPDLDLMSNTSLQISSIQQASSQQQQQAVEQYIRTPLPRPSPPEHNLYNTLVQAPPVEQFVSPQVQVQQQQQAPPPPYHSVISKTNAKSHNKNLKMAGQIYSKSVYAGYQEHVNDRIQMQEMPQPQDLQFKIPQTTSDQRQTGYKFTPPTVPANFKFTSQVSQMLQPHTHCAHVQYNTPSFHSQKEEKPEGRVHRGRQRSRSNNREPVRRPPLVTAVSDSSLLTTNSVLLTQLLTNNTDSVRIKEEHSPIPILPQPPPVSTTLITIPVKISQASPSDPLLLNSFSNSNSPTLDTSQSLNSPTSSQGSIGSPNRDNRDPRRAGHIHAEQKRRYNIKNGFDMIHSLIPQLNQNPNAKLSKAAMLHKGAEYIRQLRSERNQINEEIECLKQQIESLNTSISNCQSMLPATGAPVSRRRDSKMQEMFDDYIRKRTMENFKYWIFSLLFRPVLESFNNFVSSSSLDELYRTTVSWIEQHCTLVDLRPVVLQSLTYLSTKTDILSNPDRLPDEARQNVMTPKPK